MRFVADLYLNRVVVAEKRAENQLRVEIPAELNLDRSVGAQECLENQLAVKGPAGGRLEGVAKVSW